MRRLVIPITLTELNDGGYHLLIVISIHGQEKWAVLDTGASRSVIDKNTLELDTSCTVKKGYMPATTLFTSTGCTKIIIPTLKIGRLVITDYETFAIDLTNLNQTYLSYGHPRISAIIGSDILYKFDAIIDYKKQQVSFCNHGRNQS